MFLNIVTASRKVIKFFIFSKCKKEKKYKKCKREKVIFLEKKIFIIIT